ARSERARDALVPRRRWRTDTVDGAAALRGGKADRPRGGHQRGHRRRSRSGGRARAAERPRWRADDPPVRAGRARGSRRAARRGRARHDRVGWKGRQGPEREAEHLQLLDGVRRRHEHADVRLGDRGARAVRRIVGIAVLSLAAAFASACGPLVEGGGGDLISGHVTEILETGDRVPLGSGLPQPFQRVRVQLDESLYRGEIVELQWGGRRALDANGFLRPGDRVLLSVTRDGNSRTYAILDIVRLPALIPVAA